MTNAWRTRRKESPQREACMEDDERWEGGAGTWRADVEKQAGHLRVACGGFSAGAKYELYTNQVPLEPSRRPTMLQKMDCFFSTRVCWDLGCTVYTEDTMRSA